MAKRPLSKATLERLIEEWEKPRERGKRIILNAQVLQNADGSSREEIRIIYNPDTPYAEIIIESK